MQRVPEQKPRSIEVVDRQRDALAVPRSTYNDPRHLLRRVNGVKSYLTFFSDGIDLDLHFGPLMFVYDRPSLGPIASEILDIIEKFPLATFFSWRGLFLIFL